MTKRKKMFDWKTDDEEDWREEPVVEKKRISPHRRRRIYWRLLIAVLVLLIGGAIAYSQINRRVENATEAVADDLINTHQLLMQAAIDQDRELFRTFIQPVNHQFSQNQEALLTRTLFLNRAPLGLWFDYETAVSLDWVEISQVTLSPDLTEAELGVDLPYLYQNDVGEVQSVTLRQTAVYQQDGNGRWQLIEPTKSFWGDYETDEQPRLKIIFPARDAEVGHRLAVDLSLLLVQLCNTVEIACSDELIVELRLNRDIDKLVELNRNYQWETRFGELRDVVMPLDLPAPSLVGIPVDDDGYSALQRGYASLLAATMMHQFGLATSDNRLPDQIEIQQQLAAYQLILPSALNTHPQQITEPPPIPFPDQDVILMCRNQFENVLYQYQIQENQWQTIPILGGGVSGMSALSNGDGVLVSLENRNGEAGSQLVWLQGTQARLLVEDDRFLSVFSSFMMAQLDESDPLQHIIRYGVVTANGFESAVGLLDEESCTNEACELQLVDQVPNLSPNGRFQLLSTELTFVSEIVLADADGELVQSLGNGMSPRWIDDQTFTFVEVEEQEDGAGIGETVLITAVIFPDGTLAQTRTTVDDLLPALPTDAAAEELFILGSSSIGAGEQLIYLYSIDEQFSLQYLLQSTEKFDLNAQLEPVKLIEAFTDVEMAMILGVGSNGRFPYFAVNQSGEPDDTTLRLYDVEQNSWQTFAMSSVWGGSVAWSTDDNWLLLLEKEALHFVLPGYDYDRPVFHDFQNCETAVWVNQP